MLGMELQNRRWPMPRSEQDDGAKAVHQQPTFPAVRAGELDVSVVIVSWNTRDILRGCIRSVFEQTREASFEVFVIDNNSQDGPGEIVRAEFPTVKLIANAENRSFAAAGN